MVGQQSLAVFLASLVVAQAFGVALDLIGRDLFTVAVANIAGFALLIVTAKTAAFFKSQPWRQDPTLRKQSANLETSAVVSDGATKGTPIAP